MSNSEVEDIKTVPRGSCFGAAVLLLLLALLPYFGCRLITQGVLQFGNETGNFLNIFLLQEPDKEGLGVQWTRSFDDEAICTRSTVRYFMFDGEAENLDFCECTNQPVSRPLPDMCSLSDP